MDKKQQTAILALPVLFVTMLGVYRLAAWLLGPELAWYAGFWIYWPVWCVLYPWWMLERRRMWGLFQKGSPGVSEWLLVFTPPVLAFIGRYVMEFPQHGAWEIMVLVLMSCANGLLEEVLWRGVYIELFPDHKLWGFAWPTVWFALWHFAPGIHSELNAWLLVGGAAVFGACWGWVALKSGTIRWSVLSHTLAALARVL